MWIVCLRTVRKYVTVPHIEMLKNLDLQVGIRGETPLTDKLSWWKEQNACLLGAS